MIRLKHWEFWRSAVCHEDGAGTGAAAWRLTQNKLVYAGLLLRRTPIFHFKPAGYGSVQLRRLR